MTADLDVAVLGDLHGVLDLGEDAPLLARFPLLLCTGDLTPNFGRGRFDEALRCARDLAALRAWTVLGNHDGPTCFTGRRFPRSYVRLTEALGDHHLSGRRIELPELGLSLVGGRPLTCGGPRVRFEAPGREGWSLQRWGDELGSLLRACEQERIIVLAHCGPTGLGARRDDIYGCDFRAEQGDWGDLDLRLALDAADDGRVVAVIAGHMHHELQGGGLRRRACREGARLHVNAAVVPRVVDGARAVTVVHLRGRHATARQEWQRAGAPPQVEDLEAEVGSP